MTATVRALLAFKGRDVEAVTPSTPVFVAVQQMNQQHVGSLVVIDGDALIGILTERDMLARVLGGYRDPLETTVRDVMTRDPVTIDVDATVEEALVVVSDRRCRHLPVVERGALYGLISAGDLMAWLVRDQQLTIADLQDFITH